MLNILIVDDHPIVRIGIREIVSTIPGNISIDEAGDGKETIEKVWNHNYDIILLDISMPGRNGLEILKEIKSIKPHLKVLILSFHPEDQLAVRAIQAGADGYMTKSCIPDDLVTAMKQIIKGEKYITTSLASRLACYFEAGYETLPHEALSDREFEVMAMSAMGKTVKKIAVELNLSEKTISTYRSRVLNKMNMDSIAHLIQYSIKNKLIDTELL